MKGVRALSRFAGLLLIVIAAGCVSSRGLETPQSVIEGRVLDQNVMTAADALSVCVLLRNVSDRRAFISRGAELVTQFYSESGQLLREERHEWANRVSVSDVDAYQEIGLRGTGADAISDCQGFYYPVDPAGPVVIRATWQSALGRDSELPASLAEAIATGTHVRPLYRDEELASNTCVIQRRMWRQGWRASCERTLYPRRQPRIGWIRE